MSTFDDIVPIAILALLAAGPAWLCLGWPLAAMVGRARRRSQLRGLLGSGFSSEKTYVRWQTGIGVNEQRGEFAVARSDVALLCKAEDILDVRLVPSHSPQLGGQTLSIDIKNEKLPTIRIDTGSISLKLGEIAARLKVMQKAEKAKELSPEEPIKDVSRGLEQAVSTLAQAVTTLANAINSRGQTKATD